MPTRHVPKAYQYDLEVIVVEVVVVRDDGCCSANTAVSLIIVETVDRLPDNPVVSEKINALSHGSLDVMLYRLLRPVATRPIVAALKLAINVPRGIQWGISLDHHNHTPRPDCEWSWSRTFSRGASA